MSLSGTRFELVSISIARQTSTRGGRRTRRHGTCGRHSWPELETEAYRVYRLRNESADLFEQAWPCFRPCVEARVERDFSEGDGLDDYQSAAFSAMNRAVSQPPAVGVPQLPEARPPAQGVLPYRQSSLSAVYFRGPRVSSPVLLSTDERDSHAILRRRTDHDDLAEFLSSVAGPVSPAVAREPAPPSR
jgi:hypothetical protein